MYTIDTAMGTARIDTEPASSKARVEAFRHAAREEKNIPVIGASPVVSFCTSTESFSSSTANFGHVFWFEDEVENDVVMDES
jgi:hypothetical protein